MYVWFFLKHTYASGINGVLVAKAMGSTVDIIQFLRFCFLKPVYYKFDDRNITSDSTENGGYWVGIIEHIVHIMIFKFLTDDIQEFLFCYNIIFA